MASEDHRHIASCKRDDCNHIGETECAFWTIAIDETIHEICPVCGRFDDLAFEAMADGTMTGENLPMGEAIIRGMKAPFEGVLFAFTAGYEYSGEIQPLKTMATVSISQDGATMDAFTLVRVDVTEKDGVRTENRTELAFTFEENILTFETETEGLFLLVPVQ